MRILCKIFGCQSSDPYYPGCDRCGTDIYHWDFVQDRAAWLWPWYSFKWWVRCNQKFFIHRCGNEDCRKLVFFTKNQCCSEECYSNWIPF